MVKVFVFSKPKCVWQFGIGGEEAEEFRTNSSNSFVMGRKIIPQAPLNTSRFILSSPKFEGFWRISKNILGEGFGILLLPTTNQLLLLVLNLPLSSLSKLPNTTLMYSLLRFQRFFHCLILFINPLPLFVSLVFLCTWACQW